jgi:hypothetical protein
MWTEFRTNTLALFQEAATKSVTQENAFELFHFFDYKLRKESGSVDAMRVKDLISDKEISTSVWSAAGQAVSTGMLTAHSVPAFAFWTFQARTEPLIFTSDLCEPECLAFTHMQSGCLPSTRHQRREPALVPLCLGRTGAQVRLPGAFRPASPEAQLKGGSPRLLETRRSHRPLARRLGKGMEEESPRHGKAQGSRGRFSIPATEQRYQPRAGYCASASGLTVLACRPRL